jgi:FAD/FMN-containing dehydrogenase
LGEILSACEFVDGEGIHYPIEYLKCRDPFDQRHAFYCLIETQGSNSEHDTAKLDTLTEHLLEKNIVDDGLVAADTTQAQALWYMREAMASAIKQAGYVYKYDLSLPLDNYYALVEVMRERLRGHNAAVVGYGHVGDANLHLNVIAPAWDEAIFNIIEPFVFDYTAKCGGSVSAEHGIGSAKTQFLGHSKSAAAIELMWKIKAALDPNSILNPYKVLPNKNP